MCTNLTPKWDGYVYKRRKLQINTVGKIFKGNVMAPREGITDYLSGTEDSLFVQKGDLANIPDTSSSAGDSSKVPHGSGSLPVSGNYLMQRSPTDNCSSTNGGISNLMPIDGCSAREGKVRFELPTDTPYRSSSDTHSSVNGNISSLKHISKRNTSLKHGIVGSEECSSTDTVAIEIFSETTSARELCISVLRRNGLLSEARTESTCSSVEVLRDDNDISFQSCKICGIPGIPKNMLICDLCEEAFHPTCCKIVVKKIKVDEWYCQLCFRKRPKNLLNCGSGKSFISITKRSNDPILSMLRDPQPFTTGVRIGREFQVGVPEWFGTVSLENKYFGEHSELDLTECANLNVWNYIKPSQRRSIGNWIQCREIVQNADGNVEGTVCGKWRRAPLFVVRSDDWDCSCCIPWDPTHADCNVPQELDTDTVLKHLKCVEMLMPRLINYNAETRPNRS